MHATWHRGFDSTEDLSRICVCKSSPAVRLSLDEHVKGGIEAQLATPTCSTPGDKIPALIGPLAAILQRCVALNDSQIVQTSTLTCIRSSAAVSPSSAGRQSGRALHQLMQPCSSRNNKPQDQLAASHAAEFRGRRAPSVSIHAYLHRFAKYAKCSPVCFVMAQTYLERLSQIDEALLPGPFNVHRLLTVGIMLAAKLMDDRYFNNAYYAKIGGVTLEELNKLELRMMALLDYRLRVDAAIISVALTQLTQQAAQLPQPDFVAAFGHLLLPSVVRSAACGTLPSSAKGTGPCTADFASDAVVTSSVVSAASAAHIPGSSPSDSYDTAIRPSLATFSALKVTGPSQKPEPACQTSASEFKQAAGFDFSKQTPSESTISGSVATDSSSKAGCSRPEGAKPLSVRFSDQLHSAGTSTPLTAAALCAASLKEESDSRQWRASLRSSSVTSICSSAGSSCHRAAVGVSLPTSGIPAC